MEGDTYLHEHHPAVSPGGGGGGGYGGVGEGEGFQGQRGGLEDGGDERVSPTTPGFVGLRDHGRGEGEEGMGVESPVLGRRE